MKLLEYQAKELLDHFGLPRPRGLVCREPAEAARACEELACAVVLKAQVPAGRRGKGGGIRSASSADEAGREAESLLGSSVCGFSVDAALVEEQLSIRAELYLSVLTDTSSRHSCPMVMLSAEGGMEIEELTVRAPERLVRCHVDPRYGLLPYQVRRLMREAGIPIEGQAAVLKVALAAYQAYWESDAELVEINPLALTTDGRVVAMDAKISIDDSARFRHPEIRGSELDSVESRAAALGLSYVRLDGNIGIISNGAGLTMATMDHVRLAGGRPANFMDTGERILRDGIRDGLAILHDDPGVEVVLINVFGGGVRCDVIAQKIVESVTAEPEATLPLVVSLNGRNAEAGRRILSEAALPGVTVAAGITEALETAVSVAGGGR